jgi:hypothetical protein
VPPTAAGPVGGERFARDAPLKLERTERGYHRDRPAAVAHGTHCLVHGLTPDAIEEPVDAASDHAQDLFGPVGGVVEDFAGAQAPRRYSWLGGLATPSGRAPIAGAICTAALPTPSAAAVMSAVSPGWQQPPVDQALVGGPGADHQPSRPLEAGLVGHGGQAVRRRQCQLGEPAYTGRTR